ncbi:MAG TPA: sugar transporter [Phaeodactylibacter sp.]|nr:sugar transporter [Phaeodactylibacter sp.]
MKKILFPTICLLLGMSSCVQYRDLLNFNEGPEFPQSGNEIVADYRLRVQPDDIIYIGVHTVPPELSMPYNLVNRNIGGGNVGANPLLGYLVAPDGSIDMVGVGRLQVGGMTLEEVKAVAEDSLSHYLKDFVVDVRFLNFRITVLGEVASPGTYTFPQQRVTIMEALGMAGDITQFGSRDSILVVREAGGQREYGYINLHDRAVFESPYFYLKQNDLIYVEPTKAKLTVVSDPARRISPWLGIVSSLTLLVLTLANL